MPEHTLGGSALGSKSLGSGSKVCGQYAMTVWLQMKDEMVIRLFIIFLLLYYPYKLLGHPELISERKMTI